MNTQHYSTLINAPRQLVWDVMLGAETFQIWTAEFAEGSRFEGGWEQGATIRFLDPDGNGMVATIAENRSHAFVSIKHRGFINAGVDDTTSDAVRAWAPAWENYTLSDVGPATELRIDVDAIPGLEAFMQDAWPRALARLKAICEERALGEDVRVSG